jgi:hypothetical protein
MDNGQVTTRLNAAVSPDVRTYSLRYVRRLLLEELCRSGHPILDVENQLMAEAAASIRASGRPARESVAAVKEAVMRRILMAAEDPELKSKFIDRLESDGFDDLRDPQ